MKAIQFISQDLFDKIRSKFTNLEMGDEAGSVTIDPAEARFFDFDFVRENVNLGRVSISLNDLGSLKIYYSQGITENKDDAAKKLWYDFLKEMRQFAMRRLLRFDTRDVAKTNLDRNDFQYLASKTPKEDTTMNMNESRWMVEKSSKKTSRAVKGGTQVIVRHHKPVEETFPGARSQRKNIKAIYIENRDGERFKYPFIHPAGAFAMAQHVDHGGVPHDPAGKAIIKMSEQIAQLQEFQRQVQHSSLHDDAMGIKERAIGRLQELKGRIESLGKRQHYESWLQEFDTNNSGEDEMLSELDPVTFEEYKSKFTQKSFKEELGKYFPLIHSIMQEKIDLEQYVQEGSDDEVDESSDVRTDSFEEFEQWAEDVEMGKFNRAGLDDKLQGADLKEKLSSINLGPNGTLAWAEISDLFGLDERDADDAALKDQLAAKAQSADIEASGEDGPVMDVFKSWIEDSFPEWMPELPELFQDAGQPQPEEPAPEQPAEPMQPAPEEPVQQQPVAEDKDSSTMIQEIAKLVKSRFNKDNPNVGPFNGQEGILLDVEKTISEKFGEQAGTKARHIAEKFMEKLTQKWQEEHSNTLMGEKSEIDRLRELLGNVKQKVEGMGDKTSQRDTNIKWRDHARDALKDKRPYSPTGNPDYVARMKKLSGISDKK